MFNSSIWPIDKTLLRATTLDQSGPGSNVNEEVLCIPQNITIASPSDCLVSHTGHSLEGVLPLCRDVVGLFYGPATSSWLNWQKLLTRSCIRLTLCDKILYHIFRKFGKCKNSSFNNHKMVNIAIRKCLFFFADALQKITKTEGLHALWNGTGPSLLLSTNPAIQFAIYELLKRYFQIICKTKVSICPLITFSNHFFNIECYMINHLTER